MNDKFQNALKGVPQAVPPIWFMRQAGRYHSHYQALRAKHNFAELCKNPALAAQVALGPVQDFDFDVSILFSDLLFILEAMGFGLNYEEAGPKLSFQLNDQTISQLKDRDRAIEFMGFQKVAMQETRKVLPKNKSLIGFVGGPWTLFGYAVEGSHAGGLLNAKRNITLFDSFCAHLMPVLEKNIELQLEGSAEVVMIFDTAAGELSPQLFTDLVYPKLRQLSQKFSKSVGYYARGVTMDHLYKTVLPDSNWAGFGVDHRHGLPDILKQKKSGFLQGNFDQYLLFANAQDFEQHMFKFIDGFKRLSVAERKGWVCGLGHGILPKTPEQNVRRFVQMVRENFQ